MNDSEFFAYVHMTSDGIPFYVGKATSLDRVFDFTHRNRYWQEFVDQLGEDNVRVCIIPCSSEEEAFGFEKFLIKFFRKVKAPLCNITDGGENASGWRMSEEGRAKIAKAARERAVQGTCFTEEARKRGREASANRAGYSHSPETIEKMRSSWTEDRRRAQGIRTANMSDETRLKISQSKIGIKRPDVTLRLLGIIGAKHTPATKEKMSIAKAGRVWLSKEGYTKLVSKEEAIILAKEGWIFGRALRSNASKMWINDGTKSIMVTKNEAENLIEKGWSLGRIGWKTETRSPKSLKRATGRAIANLI